MKGTFVFVSLMACSLAQRSPYAGNRPIGYPEIVAPTTTADPLGNRFGQGTTDRLPIEALGDRDLVNRISKLPIDQQPFWYLNWKALEEHRKNPQTYPQKESPFIEDNNPSQNQANLNQPQGNISQGNVPQGIIPQGGSPQRNSNEMPQADSPAVTLPRTENRFSETNNQNKKSQLNANPGNSEDSYVNLGDIDHILGMPNDTKKEPGNTDQIMGVPRNETKQNTSTKMNESQGNKAVKDFSKYFLPRQQ